MSRRNVGAPADEPTRFGWALDDTSHPTPITLAHFDSHYTCPICGDPMKPTRRGSKPSFNHKGLAACTPAEIAAQSAVPWLTNTLRYFMESGERCMVEWKAEGREFSSNWLGGVTSIAVNEQTPLGTVDLALKGSGDEIKSVFFTHRPDKNVMKAFADAGVPVALPQALPFLEGQVTLGMLLEGMDVMGGWWLLQDDENDPNLQTKPPVLWNIFRDQLAQSPFSYCARLDTIGRFEFVMTVGEHRLWLPMELWQAVFGGTTNKINRELTIISNRWHQEDNSVIELFYVIMQKRGEALVTRQDRAVGLRRHFPAEGGILRSGLDYAVKPNANAEEIACALVRSRTGDLRY